MQAHTRNTLMGMLILSILLNLFPAPVEAASPQRSLDHAVDLMVAARGILLEEDVDEGEPIAGGGMFSLRAGVKPDSPAEQILVRMINATKRELEDIERACREVRGSFSDAGQECEEELSRTYCDQRQAQLKARLSFLRKVRGDRRKGLTKTWHSIKRAGARIWRNIGPAGRRFLRDLGSEALTVISSGGSLHGGVLRRLIIKHARNVGQKTLEGILERGVQRMIVGKAQAGGDDCGEALAAPAGEKNGSPDCTDQDWFDQAWADIELMLLAGRQNCQPTATFLLKDCLLRQSDAGVCQDDAAAACQNIFDAIPQNDAGGTVTKTGEVNHGGTVANEATITYPSGGGAVSGSFYYQIYDDVFLCTITITTTEVTGQYDLETCSMRGTAYMTLHYDGLTCVSVCGPTENSPAPCPVTIEGATVWEATLEDGVLSGGVGGAACEPHCFGFRSPGYGVNP